MDRIYVSRVKGILQNSDHEFVDPEKVVLASGETIGNVLERVKKLEEENKNLKQIIAKMTEVVLKI